MTTFSRQEIGALGEQVAVEHLQALGWRILQRNWRCRYGELDLIAADGQRTVVFVEVKARATLDEALTAVTPQKTRRLSSACRRWLTENDWAMALTLRGDLLAMAPRRFPRHLEAAIDLDLGHA